MSRHRRKYIGAYTDDKGRDRPITARTSSSSRTGIPMRTRNNGDGLGMGRPGLEEKITIDGVTMTRRQWLEHDGTEIYMVDGKPSLSQYFYVPIESYQPSKEWAQSDLEELEEREARASAEARRAYDEWLTREPTKGDNALILLSATRMNRRDRKVWEGMEAQVVAHTDSPYKGGPLTEKQEKYISDIARKYRRQIRSIAKARGDSDPVYLEAYRDLFGEDP